MSDPHVSPTWVRETLVEDAVQRFQRAGVDVSSTEVDRAVTEDLRLADAYSRDTKVPASRPKVIPSFTAPGMRARRVAEGLGSSVYKRPVNVAPPPRVKPKRCAFLDRPPQNAKQAAVITRLIAILGIKSRFRPSLVNDYTIPALADEWATLMVDLTSPRGEFVGKSTVDSERMFWAKAERICERSTGKLGPYWVK